MKHFTNRQKQWLWFAGLWLSGVAGMFLLAQAARWLVGL